LPEKRLENARETPLRVRRSAKQSRAADIQPEAAGCQPRIANFAKVCLGATPNPDKVAIMNAGVSERTERRLAAILAADVAGYSRHRCRLKCHGAMNFFGACALREYTDWGHRDKGGRG
jgi:hypothetical protein